MSRNKLSSYYKNLEKNIELVNDGKKNQVGDNIWFIKDSRTKKVRVFNWKKSMDKYEINIDQIKWCQRLTLLKYPPEENGDLIYRSGSVKGHCYSTVHLWDAANKSELSKKPIELWEDADLSKLLHTSLIKRKHEINNSDVWRGIHNRGKVENIIRVLRESHDYYQNGKIESGLSFYPAENIMLETLSSYIEKIGYNPKEWRNGNSWVSVPLEVAMLQLSEAITIIRSDKTKAALTFFKYSRENLNFTHWIIFKKKIYKDLLNSNFERKSRTHESTVHLCRGFYDLLMEEVPQYNGEFPFESQREIYQHCDKVRDATVVALLILTGIRASELASIKSDWFYKDSNGAWVFKSRIVKTDYGLITVRGFSGLAAEFCDTLNGLSYIDKAKFSLKLLAKTWALDFKKQNYEKFNNPNLIVSEAGIANYVKRFHQDICTKYGAQITDTHGHCHPHQYRHTFAEFALRRFDGNVLEEIRNHYRHAWGSYMTRRYTNKKLDSEERNKLEKDYIAEIAERMSMDNLDEFSGPLALFIKKKVNEKFKTKSPKEFESLLTGFVQKLNKITPHEWGYCIINDESIEQAKCYNAEINDLEIDEKASIEKCSSCCHRLTHCSQKEDIIRIGVSHQNFIDNYPLPVLKEQSKKAVAACALLLQEINVNFL